MVVNQDHGAITVRFGGCTNGRPNCLPVMDGWNYLVRATVMVIGIVWSFVLAVVAWPTPTVIAPSGVVWPRTRWLAAVPPR